MSSKSPHQDDESEIAEAEADELRRQLLVNKNSAFADGDRAGAPTNGTPADLGSIHVGSHNYRTDHRQHAVESDTEIPVSTEPDENKTTEKATDGFDRPAPVEQAMDGAVPSSKSAASLNVIEPLAPVPDGLITVPGRVGAAVSRDRIEDVPAAVEEAAPVAKENTDEVVGAAPGEVSETASEAPSEAPAESSRRTVVVENLNAAPDAAETAVALGEDLALRLDVLSAASDPDDGDLLSLTHAGLTSGEGRVSIVDGSILYDPGSAYDYLAPGETATVTIGYGIEDQDGLSDHAVVTVTITGSNDAPRLSSPLAGHSLTEDAAFHYQIPTDSFQDIDRSDSLSFSATLADGSPLPDWLSFDPATGSFSGTPENDDVGALHVRVVASDGFGATAGDTFRINVANTNDTPHDLTVDTGSVAENAAGGTVVGSAAASDVDAGDSLTYSLADNADGRFAIDADTGEITVADGAVLDYESATAHGITVRVTDSAGQNIDKPVTVNLADQNEAPVTLDVTADAVIENAIGGTVVGSAAASDVDAGDSLTYSLADNADGRFAIDAESGEITVADGAVLDYESATSHGITVQVTDSGGNTRTEQVTIDLTNEVGDEIHGTDGNDRLYGTTEDESIYGGAGNDTVLGGDGGDRLDGGVGNDYLRGDGGDDTIIGGEGRDRLYGGEGDDALDGGASRDTLYGGDGSDRLSGGADHDYLRGDAGSDTLDGGDGNDRLYGGTGDDIVDAGAGNDSVYGDEGADRLDGGDGIDYLRYEQSTAGVQVDLAAGTASGGHAEGDVISNFERVLGSAHDDTLTGDDGANILYGRAGDDRIDGGAGNDNLRGEDGNDTVIGGAGNDYLYGHDGQDVLDGGDGRDRLYGGSGDDVLRAGDGNDGLYGDDGNDTLDGGDGNDTLQGGAGDDVIDAGSGNDSVYGGAGADRLDGGDGIDYLRYDKSAAGVQVDLTAGTAAGGDAEGDVISNFERLVGSAHGDALIGDDGANILYGRAGDDRIEAGAGNDYLRGEDGDDTLVGGDGKDRLYGDAGNDMLDGGAGNDTLDGGAGDDVISAGDGNDSIYGGAGADQLDGGEGIDYLRYDKSTAGVQVNLAAGTAAGGDAEGDSITGFERLVGSAHDDALTGDDGANYLYGRAGDDRIEAGAGNDYLRGEAGDDTLVGGEGNDNLRGEAGDDTVLGGAGNDYVYGHDGRDTLEGGDGNDRLYGGAGDDWLEGGSGDDYLSGGDGADLFTISEGQGHDRISGGADAEWTDTIALQNASGSLGEHGTDWTITIDQGAITDQGSDNNGSWLDLTQDASGTITMQDGTEISFDGIEHIQW